MAGRIYGTRELAFIKPAIEQTRLRLAVAVIGTLVIAAVMLQAQQENTLPR